MNPQKKLQLQFQPNVQQLVTQPMTDRHQQTQDQEPINSIVRC